MKKYIYYILLAGLASVLIARAQTNAASQPVDNTNAAVADATTNVTTTTVAVAVTNTTVTTVDTNAPMAMANSPMLKLPVASLMTPIR